VKRGMDSTDPDIRGSLPALRRAAKSARAIARKTHTPLVVWLEGKVVKLDPGHPMPGSRRETRG